MRKFIYTSADTSLLPTQPGVALPDGLPFVLNDEFAPVHEINSWLKSLDSRGCHSIKTWSGYADDIMHWVAFLELRKQSLVGDPDALLESIHLYRQIRLRGTSDKQFRHFKQLRPTTWNRIVAALENFYVWAVEHRLMTRRPFNYKQIRVRSGFRVGHEVEHNFAKAKAGSALSTMRHLSPDFADLFVNVGLGGLLPDGEADSGFRGRVGVRNRAAGMLARSSGLRRQEMSNLLVWEAPRAVGPFENFTGIDVSPRIAKGGRGRSTWLSKGSIEAVNDYIALERSLAVEGSRWVPDRPLHVKLPTEQGGFIDGTWTDWATVSIEDRRRLVGPNGGSALLFVSETGAPLGEANWRYTFDAAAERCRLFDTRFPRVTPHMLRHTMAMETLDYLIRTATARNGRLAQIVKADPILMSILRSNDPMLILRDMLGHASVSTTEVYLKAKDPKSMLHESEWEMAEADFARAGLAMNS